MDYNKDDSGLIWLRCTSLLTFVMHTRWYSGIKSASINLYNFWHQLRACFMTSVGCIDISDFIYNFFTRYCSCVEITKQILSR
jgi:hypothetical protein